MTDPASTDPASTDRATRLRYVTADGARRYAADLRHPVARVITAGERRAVRRAVAAAHRRSSGDGGTHVAFRDMVWLDVAAGSGKLVDAGLPPRRIAVDVSAAMLAEDRSGHPAVVGDARALPFADGAVDVVVVLRLLHRCSDEMVRAVVAEGLRVARHGVVISDVRPTPSWRARARRVLGRSPAPIGRSRSRLTRLVVDSGGLVTADLPTVPLLSSGRVALITSTESRFRVTKPLLNH